MKPYVSPLRSAVLVCLGGEDLWSIETVQGLAGVTLRATRMYLTQLVRRDVLCEDNGLFASGPAAEAYQAECPKTKPGGNSIRYRTRQRMLDELAQRDWQARRAGLTFDASPGGHDGAQVEIMEVGADDTVQKSMRVRDVARTLEVHPRTVRRWVLSGRVKGFRLPNGEYRVLRSAVDQILEGPQHGEG